MRSTSFILFSAICLFCILQSGCLINHSNHIVVRQNEALRTVTFESEDARNIFENSVETAIDDKSNQSSASFGIPFIVGLERTKSISSNAIRNDVAAMYDVNGDHYISDYEAALRSGQIIKE